MTGLHRRRLSPPSDKKRKFGTFGVGRIWETIPGDDLAIKKSREPSWAERTFEWLGPQHRQQHSFRGLGVTW